MTTESPVERAHQPETPRLSYSIAKTMKQRSPKHAWQEHRLLGGTKKAPSDDMIRGKIMEAMVTGDDGSLFVIDADSYRTKVAKEARAEAEAKDLTPVLAHKLDGYAKAAEAIRDRLKNAMVYFSGKHQVRMEWDSNGVACSGVLDHLILDEKKAMIYDLKCVSNASPVKLQRTIFDMGYDIQEAAYREAVETLHPELAGKVKFRFIFFEYEAPYEVVIAQNLGTMRQLGDNRWATAVKTWGKCLKENDWPGYMEGDVVGIEALPWQMDAILENSEDGDATV